MIAPAPSARLIRWPADRGATLLKGRFLVEGEGFRAGSDRCKKNENCGDAASCARCHGLLPVIIIATETRCDRSAMGCRPKRKIENRRAHIVPDQLQ
ncbi:hypothetical protein CSIRO_2700 [Bradyrhizobiaceae bacterium SG-6C]|nr:hypothetical protein CSIRO_2700 [Bradyrhizobiaceae bacterium SG-6C]